MRGMKLNIKKINQELTRLNWTRTEYARQLKISKQLLSYYMNSDLKTLSVVETLARPLNIDPKDLLV